MPKVLRRILKTIIDVLTLLIFAVLVLLIYGNVKMMFTGNDYSEIFGYSTFEVASGSMEPTFSKDDIVIVKSQDSYDVGDIISFKNKENEVITHRIKTKRGNVLTTRGDANNSDDGATITMDRIIGKVVKVLKKGGIWKKVFSDPIIIIMVFVTLILFDFAFSYKGFKNKKNAKIVDKLGDVSLKQVNKMPDSPQMSNLEIVELVKKTDMVKNGEEVNFDKKEKEFLNYTVRLDLNELQKRINGKMKGQ